MVWLRFFIGVIACASSVIFIKSTSINASMLAAMRLTLAIAILLPFFLHAQKKHPGEHPGRLWMRSVLPGCFLGLHFITWNMGARLTLAVHATLIVNMVPVVLPLLLWMTHKEQVSKMEWVATVASICGVSWLAFHDYHFSSEYLAGDLICFLSMVLFAAYLALGRKNRHSKSVLLYVFPVYTVAAIVCLIGSIPHMTSLADLKLNDLLAATSLALIPTIIGHSSINEAMRHLRGQVVGVVNVSQFCFSGVLAYFIFHEIPHNTFYAVSVFIVASCCLAIVSHKKGKDDPNEIDEPG